MASFFVRSVFGVQAETFARPGFQGCAFNRASAEAPPGSAAYEVPRAYRRWLHEFLRELAAAAGAPDPGSGRHRKLDQSAPTGA